MEFIRAIDLVLYHEGGYVNDPKDPGGETKFGISKRSYPDLDIKQLTYDQAKIIYYNDYWEDNNISKLPSKIRLTVFDSAINQGSYAAVSMLQRTVGAESIDGIIGPKTIAKVKEMDVNDVLHAYSMARHHRYTQSRNFKLYGAGWTKRLLDITILCLTE